MGEQASQVWAQLSNSLEDVAQACMPTAMDRQVRSRLIEKVDGALRACAWLVQGRIMPYGSFISGIYNSCSDLDLAVVGYVSWEFLDRTSQRKLMDMGMTPGLVPLNQLDKFAKGQVLRKVVNKLMDHGVTTRDSLLYILHARVPIIKFKDRMSGVECDLAVGGDAQHVKAATFGLLKEVCPQLAPLYNVVKQWAKGHGMNDGTIGMFNSHCLALLVIFYLQTCHEQALPPIYRLFYSSRPPDDAPRLLQPPFDPANADAALQMAHARVDRARAEYSQRLSGRSLVDLLQGFVEFYCQLLEQVLLQPHQGMRLCTWYGELQTGQAAGGLSDYVLVVEEPMNSQDNPARTFGKRSEFPWMLHYVVDTFQRTQTVLRSLKDGTMPYSQAGLMFLFGPGSLVRTPLCDVLRAQLGTWPDWVRTQLEVKSYGEVLHEMLQVWQAPASEWVPEGYWHGPVRWKEWVMLQAKSEVRIERKDAAVKQYKAQRGGVGTQEVSQIQAEAAPGTEEDAETLATEGRGSSSACVAVEVTAGLLKQQLQLGEGGGQSEAGHLQTAEAVQELEERQLPGEVQQEEMLEVAAAATAEAAMAAAQSVAAQLEGPVDQTQALDEVHAIAAAAGLLGHAAALKAAVELHRRKSTRAAAKAAEKEQRQRQDQRRQQQQLQRQQQQLQQQPQQEQQATAAARASGGAQPSAPMDMPPRKGRSSSSSHGGPAPVFGSQGAHSQGAHGPHLQERDGGGEGRGGEGRRKDRWPRKHPKGPRGAPEDTAGAAHGHEGEGSTARQQPQQGGMRMSRRALQEAASSAATVAMSTSAPASSAAIHMAASSSGSRVPFAAEAQAAVLATRHSRDRAANGSGGGHSQQKKEGGAPQNGGEGGAGEGGRGNGYGGRGRGRGRGGRGGRPGHQDEAGGRGGGAGAGQPSAAARGPSV